MGDGSVFISLVPSQLASARMNRVSAGVTSVPHFLTCGDQNGSFTSGVGVQNHAYKCLPEFLAYLWGLYYHTNSYQGAVTKWYLPSISAPSTWNYSGLSKPHWLSFTWMVDSGNNQNPLLWESPFTSWSCCNKLLQTRWLKIRMFSSFWKPEVWNQYISSTDSFWRLRENIRPRPVCYILVVASGPWYSLAQSCFPVISASVLTWHSPLSVCVCDQISLFL